MSNIIGPASLSSVVRWHGRISAIMKDEPFDEYRQWVASNYGSDVKEQLFDIYKEAMHADQDPHGRVAKTIAKACTLMARLSHDQERVHRSIRRLTKWLVVL